MAKIGYERFYQMPEHSSTIDEIEKSSAGLLGWAQFAKANEDVDVMMREYDEAHKVNPISILTRAERSGISVVEQPGADWERIEITVDSGACDTVLPSRMLSSIRTESTEASRRGDEYEVANGHSIPNYGQKRCVMMTSGSAIPKGVIFQVSDVHKPLMSVGSMADAGFECLLSKNGGIMRDVDTGEEIPLARRGNLYILTAWVKSAEADFHRQS